MSAANRASKGMGGSDRRTKAMPEVWRQRIQTGQILRRLMDHVEGKIELSATQIRAAEILLRKILPDLSSIEYKGNVEHRHITEYTDAELVAFLERSHRRDLGGGVAAQEGSARLAAPVHGVHDAELEAGEDPPSYQ